MTTMNAAVAPAQFGMGRVITRTFEVLGKNFVPYSALAALTVAPPMVVSWALGRSYMHTVMRTPVLSAVAGQIVLLMASLIVAMMLSYVLQAALVHGTLTTLNGRPASFAECLLTAIRSAPRLLGVGLLGSLGIMLGMMLLIVPGVILALAWSVVVPACIVEQKTIGESFSRSSQLTRGHRWAIFGLVIIFGAANLAAGLALRPLTGLSFFPTPQQVIPEFGIYWIAATLLRVIVAAIAAVGIASIYYELRSMKEGVGPEQLAAVFA